MVNQKAKDHVKQAAASAFDQMDKNDDGKVTMSEFRAFCQNVPNMKGIAALFCEVDTSDDYMVSLAELEAMVEGVPDGKIEKSHVTDVFNEHDKDGNGSLDVQEFKALLNECDYSDAIVANTIDSLVGDDGKVSLQEFLDSWENDE